MSNENDMLFNAATLQVEPMIGLSVDNIFGGDHNNPEIFSFFSDFSNLLVQESGKYPQWAVNYGATRELPLRLLLGLPLKQLTIAQKRIAEACLYLLYRRTGDSLWTDKPMWNPTNRSRIDAPLEKCQLDIPFMLSLGISTTIWESNVLMHSGGLSDLGRKSDLGLMRTTTLTRNFVALAVYGFPDPLQFFTASKRHP